MHSEKLPRPVVCRTPLTRTPSLWCGENKLPISGECESHRTVARWARGDQWSLTSGEAMAACAPRSTMCCTMCPPMPRDGRRETAVKGRYLPTLV